MSDLDELEQGERVRNWLRENGSTLVTGILLGLSAIFGWQWWQNARVQAQITAATQFEAFSEALERGDSEAALVFADTLREKHEKTAFAVLAALRLAESQANAGDGDQALTTLENAPRSPDPALDAIVQLRSARLEIALGKPELALARLQATGVAGFDPLQEELRGDALLALGRSDEARHAYAEALTHIEEGSPARDIVRMKLDDLAAADRPEA